MEDLTKSQIILLTLLLSFVTSIATGIMTVSLLQQAPPAVTQTINRVVQQTVEQVVPAGKETIKETKTVVVQEEDLVINSISKNEKSIVRIQESVSGTSPELFFSIGLIVSADGLIVTDKKTYDNLSKYSAVLYDSKSVPLKFVALDEATGLLFLRAVKEADSKITFEPATLDAGNLKLGQTVIELGGQIRNKVSIGRVSDLVIWEATTVASSTVLLIKTDFAAKDNVVGSPLINLSGDLVGIRVTAVDLANDGFVPALLIKNAIAGLPN